MKLRHLKKNVQYIIALLCIAFIISFLWKNRFDLRITLNFHLTDLLIILILYLLYYFFHSWRLQIVVEKCSDSSVPLFQWFKVFILGRFLNSIIPQSGNIFRSVRLKNDYRISYTQYISAFFSFAWMDAVLTFILTALVITITGYRQMIVGISVLSGLLILAGLVAVLPLVLLGICRLIEIKLKQPFWIHEKLSLVFEATVKNLGDPFYLMKILLSGIVVAAITCLLFHTCLTALNTHVGLSQLVLFYSLFKASSYLNITPGNLGIRELAYGVLSSQLDMGAAEGIILSAILRIFNYIVLFGLSLPLGGFDMLLNRERYRSGNEKG